MEEQEHKAVAFDVYQTVAPGIAGYLRRVGAMLFATIDFLLFMPMLTAWLLKQHGELWSPRSWGRAFQHLWISPGVWRRVMAGTCAYLLPGFHPSKRPASPAMAQWRARYRPARLRSPTDTDGMFGIEQ